MEFPLHPNWIVAWIGLLTVSIVSGPFVLAEYTKLPGRMKPAPRRMKNKKALVPTLLLFVHPRCPWTLATIRQFRNLLMKKQCEVTIRLIIICPEDTTEQWYETPVIEEAKRIDDLDIVLDYEGVLCRKYGALTSGTMIAYDQNNHLIFQGGITPSRGHEGACDGADSMQAILEGGSPEHKTSSVYGCQFFE